MHFYSELKISLLYFLTINLIELCLTNQKVISSLFKHSYFPKAKKFNSSFIPVTTKRPQFQNFDLMTRLNNDFSKNNYYFAKNKNLESNPKIMSHPTYSYLNPYKNTVQLSPKLQSLKIKNIKNDHWFSSNHDSNKHKIVNQLGFKKQKILPEQKKMKPSQTSFPAMQSRPPLPAHLNATTKQGGNHVSFVYPVKTSIYDPKTYKNHNIQNLIQGNKVDDENEYGLEIEDEEFAGENVSWRKKDEDSSTVEENSSSMDYEDSSSDSFEKIGKKDADMFGVDFQPGRLVNIFFGLILILFMLIFQGYFMWIIGVAFLPGTRSFHETSIFDWTFDKTRASELFIPILNSLDLWED